MSNFSSLFGKRLINNKFEIIPIDNLNNKYIGIYFSYKI